MKNLFGKNGLYDKLVLSIKRKDITMNKYLTGIIALCVLPISTFAASNASSFNNRRLVREYKTEKSNLVHRNRKTSELAGKYYMGMRGDLSFLTWKNKYSGVDSGSDSFSFKPVVGLDLAVGYRFNQKWRGEAELGYIGKFSEKETEYYGSPKKTEFSLESYYMTANAYYYLKYGLYAGLGAGFVITDLSVEDSEVNDVAKTNLSLMGAAMFGWSYMLDEKVDFDVRYRLSVFDGGNLNIGGVDVDTGIIMNNTLSVGVRYHF